MTDEERLKEFGRICADEFKKRGFDPGVGTINMMLAEVIGIAVIRLLHLEDQERGFGDAEKK
jgi:hypothetical protein